MATILQFPVKQPTSTAPASGTSTQYIPVLPAAQASGGSSWVTWLVGAGIVAGFVGVMALQTAGDYSRHQERQRRYR